MLNPPALAPRAGSYQTPLSQMPYGQSFGPSASFGAAPAYPQPQLQRHESMGLGGAMVQYPGTPPPRMRPAPQFSPPSQFSPPPHHSAAVGQYMQHHPQENFGPVSPYPELKDLGGPLQRARHRDLPVHHPHQSHQESHGFFDTIGQFFHPQDPRGHAHGPRGHPVGYGQHHHPAGPPLMANHPRSVDDYERLADGLPNFPEQWIEDPHDNQHRPSYEQLLYSSWEHHHSLHLQDQYRQGDNLGLHNGGSDMQAMNAALAGPNAWMFNSGQGGAPQNLAAPIKAMMEAKRSEAERVRHIANQYQNERGPDDPETQEAQENALQAEAEAHGAVAVERALESAPEGQAMQQIAMSVEAFEEEKQRAERAWHDDRGQFGDNHRNTVAARLAMLQAAAAWQGALQTQSAPAERGFEAAEHPQAIANRANAASESYREESEALKRKAEQAARKYGRSDYRTTEAQKAADEAATRAKNALFEAESAQAVADGKPAPARTAEKKKTRKVQRGIC